MRLGILLSGRGSNFQAIYRAVESGSLQAEIACVISNVPDAPGLTFAVSKGLQIFALDSKGVKRVDFDRRVLEILRTNKVDLVCLAGYMRLLSPEFVDAYRNRIVNIHPSLLPAFPGLDAQTQAFDYGVKIAGCTVHYVDEGLDSGKIIAQASVEVLPEDTAQTLSAKILEQEHLLYPKAIAMALATLSKSES
ncbi:phosphoribosylglycinamide formyltransferase [Bryobacter aggregatus]|uniref:phosphoribosylglycinamide formyltransferase n=1 Tax=Bryobacter aggregatus TaxID=360054 RepID=UPI0004E128AF|nr:phosphoribosylglycinamide formyltransferase [Bryobacter aggregatus]